MMQGRDDGAAASLPEPLLKPGDFIAGYPIRQLIGRGGQSEIYEGYDVPNARLVAIKVLLFKHQINPEMRKRARAEAQLEMVLDHPNIVKVYAAGVDEAKKLFYTVMEFLDGDTLEARLRTQSPLDVREALHIAAEVADGLILLHTRKVIHRDVKPENIFLTRDDRVVLIDLGIAKLDEKEFSVIRTDANILIGTFAYMSPEQIHNRAVVDHRADFYALGLVMFKCLTGIHPAWNHHLRPTPPDARDYAAWHLSVVPPLASDVRPDVPVNVAHLVARTVEKDPERRPPTASAFADLVRELMRWIDKNPLPKRLPVPKRGMLPPGLSASEILKPLGAATTQEEEGTDGPSTAGAVPMRLHGPAVATLLAPPPAQPLRATTTGTEIIEARSVLPPPPPPQRASAPSLVALPAPTQDLARTATGTEIVGRDELGAPAPPAAPPPPALVSAAPEPPALVRARSEPPRAPLSPALESAAPPADPVTQPAPLPSVIVASPPPRDHEPRPADDSLGARTTSGHLMSLAPPPERRATPLIAWLAAAIVGVVCGITFLLLRSPSPSADAASNPSGPPPARVELADAGAPDAPVPQPAPDAGSPLVEPPDAGPADAAEPVAVSDAGDDAGTRKPQPAPKQPRHKPMFDIDDDDDLHPKKPGRPAASITSAAPKAAPTPPPAATTILPFGKAED